MNPRDPSDPNHFSSEESVPNIEGLNAAELLARALNTVSPSGDCPAWLPPEPEHLARLLPQYQIEGVLGCGGMGAVYKGMQAELDRPVAVKLLPAEVAADTGFVERFRREARTLAKLHHPGIVAVHDFGQTSEGHLYFVMEYVDGTDLRRILRGPGLAPEQALALIVQICEALQAAHRQGVIHRDIKPENVLITQDGEVKLADFGLARPLEEKASQVLTATQAVMGTPDYMSPEQRQGQSDHRTDIFALGVMLYEMLTGQVPRGAFMPPSQKVQVDVRVDEVVLKALQEAPERRYQKVSEMQTDVDRIRSTPTPVAAAPQAEPTKPQPAKRHWLLPSLATSMVLGVAAGAGWFWWNKNPRPTNPAPSPVAGTAVTASSVATRSEVGIPPANKPAPTIKPAGHPKDTEGATVIRKDLFRWTNLAGKPGGLGNADGVGSQARFNYPGELAVDDHGFVYVADRTNCILRRVGPDGMVQTITGGGSRDGVNDRQPGIGAPSGIAVDGAGNVYITANRSVRKLSPDGFVTTVAGSPTSPEDQDGKGLKAGFGSPDDICIDKEGNLFVADVKCQTIRKIAPDGTVTTLAGAPGVSGSADGSGSQAQFNHPQQIASDGHGNLYVADGGNCTIRKITPSGIVSTVAGQPGKRGVKDGRGDQALFFEAGGIAIGSDGTLYVADYYNRAIRKIAPNGFVSTLVRPPSDSEIANKSHPANRFGQPARLALDRQGNLIVSEYAALWKVSPTGSVSLLAGAPSGQGTVDGPVETARLVAPAAIAVDASDHVYVAQNHWQVLRRIEPDGAVSTVALSGPFGVGEQALTGCAAVAVDGQGNLIVSERKRHVIRRIDPSGVVTTLAGRPGIPGDQDGLGTAATFRNPVGIAADRFGNIWVQGNQTIRRIDAQGKVTTVAGRAGESGFADGLGAKARFGSADFPLVADRAGNVYMPDYGNQRIRKITPEGVVTTVAGSGISGYVDGPASTAQFSEPNGIAIDAEGNLFVTEFKNNAVRMISPDGMVTTVGGGPERTSERPGEEAKFSYLRYITADSHGNLFAADFNNNRIVKGTPKKPAAATPLPSAPVTAASASPTAPGRAEVAGTPPKPMLPTVTPVPDRTPVGTPLAVPSNIVENRIYHWSTFVGEPGGPGAADGSAEMARLSGPTGLAIDREGNCFVMDTWNDAIRKITPKGVVSTFAGLPRSPGCVNGKGSVARFCGPQGVAIDDDGTLFVADRENQVIRKVTPSGTVTTVAGSPRVTGTADGKGDAAQFNRPVSVTRYTPGVFLIADRENKTIRKMTRDGVVSTFAGTPGVAGAINGPKAKAQFDLLETVAVDASGNILVASNHAIRKIGTDGNVTTLAGSLGDEGFRDGPGPEALFCNPAGIAIGRDGTLFIADSGNHAIRRIGRDGTVTTLAGMPGPEEDAGVDGDAQHARFSAVFGIAIGGDGNLLVSDLQNCVIRRISLSGHVTTVVGKAPHRGDTDGTTSEARLTYPCGIAADRLGNLYVAEFRTNIIRKITRDGVTSTLAGVAGVAGTADGPASVARFNGPGYLAVDASGNLYLSDQNNRTIRKVTASGDVTTLAGLPGVTGAKDGIRREARFQWPTGIAVSENGVVFVADETGIRKITPAGEVTTIAGMLGIRGYAEGVGNKARFCGHLEGMAMDEHGNLFVADWSNARIRKITFDGNVSTFAGCGIRGILDGKAGKAQMSDPRGIAVGANGCIFLTDCHSHFVRMISPDGDVRTIGGYPGIASDADGFGCDARFSLPGGIAVDPEGRLFVCDSDNNRIVQGMPNRFPAQSPSTVAPSPLAGGSATLSAAASELVTGTLQASVQVPVVRRGRAVGSVTLPVGKSVRVVRAAGEQILITTPAGEVWVNRSQVALPQ